MTIVTTRKAPNGDDVIELASAEGAQINVVTRVTAEGRLEVEVVAVRGGGLAVWVETDLVLGGDDEGDSP